MINSELLNFAKRLGLNAISFDTNTPLCFILDSKYDFCLEYSKGYKEQYLVLSVKFDYDHFDNGFLLKAFKKVAFVERKSIDFAVSVSGQKLLLLTKLPVNIVATELESAILKLKNEADALLNN